MNINSSENTVEDETISQSYELWDAKISPSHMVR